MSTLCIYDITYQYEYISTRFLFEAIFNNVVSSRLWIGMGSTTGLFLGFCLTDILGTTNNAFWNNALHLVPYEILTLLNQDRIAYPT